MTGKEIGSEAVDTAVERATGIPVVTSLKDVVTGLPKTITRIIRRNANEAGENAGKAVLGTADSGDATRTLDNASVETSRGTDGAIDSNRPATRDPAATTEAKIEPGSGSAPEKVDNVTSRQARREAMRQEGIPTSQQPTSQSRNASGREQSYEVPKPGGGTQTKSVSQQTMDSSHPGEGHWEAGKVKTDPLTGETRMNNHGRPKLTNDKSKVDYDE